MKFIKGLLLFLLLLVLIGLIIGFTSPSEMNVEHTQKLKASPEAVFSQVNDLKNWDNWSIWNQMDPEMKKEYGDKTRGKGATYSWQSDNKKVGNGSMTITESVPDKTLETSLDFGDKGSGTSGMYIEPAEDGGSNVTWTMKSDLGNNPLMKLMGKMMMTPAVKKAYETSLTQLDTYIEANPDAVEANQSESGNTKMEINETTIDGFDVLATKRDIKISEMTSDVFAQGYAELMGSIEKQGLEMADQPIAIYEEWDEENDHTLFYLGIPTKTKGKLVGKINNYSIDGGKVVVADYYGPYEGSNVAHEAIDAYMEDKGLEFRGPVWEQYVTDPTTVADPSEVLTKVFYGVK